MTRGAKPTASEAFISNIADADRLLSYARAFQNSRKYRMRKELRERVGDALGIPTRDRDRMDCLENSALFLAFRDASVFGPNEFKDLRPLLRSVLVAACAAFETFLADRVMEILASAVKAENTPSRLKAIPLTVGEWMDIEEKYERRAWGMRRVVEKFVRESASTAPNKVGNTLSVVGVSNWAKSVDSKRGVASGITVAQLNALTERRNRIAHAADRQGQGRSTLTTDEVLVYVTQIKQIVDAIDAVLAKHKP